MIGILLAAALLPLTQTKAGTMDLAAVNAAIRSRPAANRPDPFEQTPLSALIGREVSLAIPFVQEGATTPSGNRVTWSYDANGQRLSLRVSPDGFYRFTAAEGQGLYGRVEAGGFRTLHQTDSKRIERMGNGFGATADVEIVHETVLGVAAFSGASLPDPGEFTADLDIAGPEARALVSSLQLIVDAAVRDYGDGQAILCGSQYVGATIDGPREIFTDACLLSVDVRRIAIVNVASGNVIREWTSASRAPSIQEITDDGLWSIERVPSFRKLGAGAGWAEMSCEVIGGTVIYKCTTQAESSPGYGDAAAAGLRSSPINHPTGFLTIRVEWPAEGAALARRLKSTATDDDRGGPEDGEERHLLMTEN